VSEIVARIWYDNKGIMAEDEMGRDRVGTAAAVDWEVLDSGWLWFTTPAGDRIMLSPAVRSLVEVQDA